MAEFLIHNQFRHGLAQFEQSDPQLLALSQLEFQHSSSWWQALDLEEPGIYILTGGRQIGKSTSCKLLIKHCLHENMFKAEHIFYLPCDEIYDASGLSKTIRNFLKTVQGNKFLLIVDEVTFVKNWDRCIKALADEGVFKQGLCLLTGSDSCILQEAALRFPGRRGQASQTDFHLYPLSFSEYVKLVTSDASVSPEQLLVHFQNYLICGGYLRAINDLAKHGKVTDATYSTYQQWVRGDFLKQGKSEESLFALLAAILTVGVSTISYTKLAQKIGVMTKDTCINYCRLLERMGILITLQAFDQNTKQGFPRKDRKFHFFDPFIATTLMKWLQRENYLSSLKIESALVEACVASHCYRVQKTFYFKGQGEVDVITLKDDVVQAIEVKWANQIRPNDLKTLKQFPHSTILGKAVQPGLIEEVKYLSVYEYLYNFV